MTMGSQSDVEISVLEQAQRLTNLGYFILPLKADKKPANAHGFYDATNDFEEIKKIYQQHPFSLIGVDCKRSGLFVIDIDMTVEKNEHGEDDWNKLCNGRDIPYGPQQRSPHGGRHILFQYPTDGTEIPSSIKKLGESLDVRGDKGYFATGPGYTWLNPIETPLPDAPEWLIKDIIEKTVPKPFQRKQTKNHAKVDASKEGERLFRRFIQKAQTGSRNDTGFALACQLRDAGVEREKAEEIMERYVAEVPQDAGDVYTVKEAMASLTQVYEREPREPLPEEKDERQTQADVYLELAKGFEVFQDPKTEKAYATIPIHDHKETWQLKQEKFKNWLGMQYYQTQKKLGSIQTRDDFINGYLAGIAGENQKEVHVRLAYANEKLYLDLANETWQVVEITQNGWQILGEAPDNVKFRRPKGMFPIPLPVTGGDINELKRFVNVTAGEEGSEEEWVLLLSWIIETFNPNGAFPVMLIGGEQGSAKSTTAKIISMLIDPSLASPRAVPKDERDMQIAAQNQLILSYDNLSGLPNQLSDAFCRLATGSGLATRELYSDDGETLFDGKRPIILNGIETAPDRNDLMDRSIFVNLPRIDDKNRQTEKALWKAFEEARPRILGAVLDIVVEGLKNMDTTTLEAPTRMADFATFIVACEGAMPWKKGTFMRVYSQNRSNATEDSLETDIVAGAIRKLMSDRDEWLGTTPKLLTELTKLEDEKTTKSKLWPATTKAIVGRIRRSTPALREDGIDIGFTREQNIRKITIKKIVAMPPDDKVLEGDEIRKVLDQIHKEGNKQGMKNVYRPADDEDPPFD
jgi:hypothetical protein